MKKPTQYRLVRILCVILLLAGGWNYYKQGEREQAVLPRSAPPRNDTVHDVKPASGVAVVPQRGPGLSEAAKSMQVNAVRELIARKLTGVNSRVVSEIVLEIIPPAAKRRSDFDNDADNRADPEWAGSSHGSTTTNQQQQRSDDSETATESDSGTMQSFDVFEIESVAGKTVLRGSSGVALASAFHWWLKYICQCQITWQDSQVHLPEKIPTVSPLIRKSSRHAFRYYFNVCTFGYSTALWDWERWEREIDWMAMNGINFPLAFTGLEFILLEVFSSLDMDKDQIRYDWFSGPAFLPWNRMGNINNWDGPLSKEYIEKSYQLQKKILQREREFGMKPILPGFTGLIPPTFTKRYPHAKVHKLTWSLAPSFGNTYFLSHEDPMFLEIGQKFMKTLISHYGTDHYYNVDPFNEMVPVSDSATYLKSIGEKLYSVMHSSDLNAHWILQGWFLMHHASFWKPTQAKAFLDSVPSDKLIVLDLWAEKHPYWKSHENFFGKNFIWCMLHNFGARPGIYASIDTVNQGVIEAVQNAPNMVGIGLSPEGIETNPIVYDFMMEFAWESDESKDLTKWVQNWSKRRYGAVTNDAASDFENYWHVLVSDILNNGDGQMGASAPAYVARPSLTLQPLSGSAGCCAPLSRYYDPQRLRIEAWPTLIRPIEEENKMNEKKNAGDTLLKLSGKSLRQLTTYQNDNIEITRQVLGDISGNLISKLLDAFKNSKVDDVRLYGDLLLDLIGDVDRILSTKPDYSIKELFHYVNSWTDDERERDRLLRNYLRQITLWGDAKPDNYLNEYAYKLWGGFVSRFYGGRWRLFLGMLERTVRTPEKFNESEWNKRVMQFEHDFSQAAQNLTAQFYTSEAEMLALDPVLLSQSLEHKWTRVVEDEVLQ